MVKEGWFLGSNMTDEEWMTQRCMCGQDCHNRAKAITTAARDLLLSEGGRWLFGLTEVVEVEEEVKQLRVALGICLTCHGRGYAIESMEVPIQDWKKTPCPDCGGKEEAPPKRG